MIFYVVTVCTMVHLANLLGPLLHVLAFGSFRAFHSRANIASHNSDLFKMASMKNFANISSQLTLNATVPRFEAGSVMCSKILFGDFPGYLSCQNVIESMPTDLYPRTIGRRGPSPWNYFIPFRVLSCK